MKIYTKTGDQGKTQVYLKQSIRLSKDDLLLECYGALDEVNSRVGLLLCHLDQQQVHPELQQIQRNLFQIGFVLSASNQLQADQLATLEQQIDHYQAQLPAQTQFELPGGCTAAAHAHLCRTATRSAERQLVKLHNRESIPPLCLAYINRLSDYFFILARWCNKQAGVTALNC